MATTFITPTKNIASDCYPAPGIALRDFADFATFEHSNLIRHLKFVAEGRPFRSFEFVGSRL
jgi:hypothetical protein